LKADYKVLDEQGNAKDQGTYEEFWVSPTKYKITFTGTAFMLTEYGTEKGILVSGPQKDTLPYHFVQIRRQFVDPIMSPDSIQRTNFDVKQREMSSIKFDCLSPITSEGIHFGTTLCLDAGKSSLRAGITQQGEAVVHNSIVKFQERYLAEELQFVQQSKPVLTAHIDSIELLRTIDEALFLPPADATPKHIRINIDGRAMEGMLVKKVVPEYPLIANETRIAGTVVLQATIDRNGRIANLYVLSGPAMLQQAALDAVKQWVYRPYVLNDEPVEVRTTINVIFTRGNPPR
jgi:TonB family protein